MLNALTLYSRVQKTNGLSILLVGALVLLIGFIIILASVPPVSRDALTHHLAIPKLYLKHGGIYEIPSIQFSYYPMNLDLLYMVPLYFENDIIPKFIHFSFALLTAWLIFGYLRTRTSMINGLAGALFFLSLPVIVKLSITVYVDLGLIFFSTAALISLFRWIESDFKWKYLILSAVCCGLAMGIKYNGLITFFLLTLFIVFTYARLSANNPKAQSKAIGAGIVFTLVALIVFSPWAVRNIIWTHNPVYPLYNGWFNSQKTDFADGIAGNSTADAIEESNTIITKSKGKWSNFAVRKIIFDEKWWEIALIPVRIFFQGEDDNPKYFDGRLNPLLFILPICAFFHIRKDSYKLKTEKMILVAFSILYILYAFFQTDMRIRYISPVIPALVILSILGLNDLTAVIQKRFKQKKSKTLWLAAVYLVVLVLFCLNIGYLFQQYRTVDPLSFIQNRISRDDYIEKYRPEYAAIQFANKRLTEDAKILAIFLGHRGYYSDREMIFDFALFKNSVHKAVSAEHLTQILKEGGITHLIVRYDLFNNWSASQFNDREKAIVESLFINHASRLFSKAGYGLFKL
jgi:hypothetical protein